MPSGTHAHTYTPINSKQMVVFTATHMHSTILFVQDGFTRMCVQLILVYMYVQCAIYSTVGLLKWHPLSDYVAHQVLNGIVQITVLQD